MSYMELKRRHQDLLSEVAGLEGKSREQEESHWTQINQFAKEIEQSKVRDMHQVSHCCHLSILILRRPTELSGKKSILIKVYTHSVAILEKKLRVGLSARNCSG